MKSKSLKGKLALNKKTVANLDGGQMHGVYGGETKTCTTGYRVCPPTCPCPTSVGNECQYTCGCPSSVNADCSECSECNC
jgi:hypothetical protein